VTRWPGSQRRITACASRSPCFLTDYLGVAELSFSFQMSFPGQEAKKALGFCISLSECSLPRKRSTDLDILIHPVSRISMRLTNSMWMRFYSLVSRPLALVISKGEPGEDAESVKYKYEANKR